MRGAANEVLARLLRSERGWLEGVDGRHQRLLGLSIDDVWTCAQAFARTIHYHGGMLSCTYDSEAVVRTHANAHAAAHASAHASARVTVRPHATNRNHAGHGSLLLRVAEEAGLRLVLSRFDLFVLFPRVNVPLAVGLEVQKANETGEELSGSRFGKSGE